MTYVISDLHGQQRRFDSILDKIQLTAEDTLYVLGDVIDRNPDGIRILRRIMAMPNAKMLLGNHELVMLKALYYIDREDKNAPNREELLHKRLDHWYRCGGRVTHEHLKHLRKSLREEIFEWVDALPLNEYLRVNGRDFLLTHAAPTALYTPDSKYLNEKEFSVWHRFDGSEEYPMDCTVIFGHSGTYHFQSDNPLKIWYGKGLIGIDCGALYPEGADPRTGRRGRLGCLRLEDMQEFYSDEQLL